MKTRSKPAPNPLRADPSRTATLRRAFAAALAKRFMRLKGQLVKLVDVDDAFGLRPEPYPFTRNVFCPTGEGGGVDPSCSPGGGRSGKEAWQMTRAEAEAKAKLPDPADDLDDIGDALRAAVVDVAGSPKDMCNSAAVALMNVYPEAEVHFGYYHGEPHTIAKLGGKYLDVTADQFGREDAEVSVMDELPKHYRGYQREFHEVGKFEKWPHAAEIYEALKENLLDEGRRIAKVRHALAVRDALVAGKPVPPQVLADYPEYASLATRPVANAGQWRFHDNATKLENFRAWLRSQIDASFKGKSDEDAYREFLRQAWARGAGRAFDDVRARRFVGREGEFYRGSKEEFLRSSFGRPVATEKLDLISRVVLNDLDGVTDQMEAGLVRVLAQGLAQGKGPRDVARDMTQQVDIGRQRAETIAQTETIRAHAEGQLVAFDQLGVEELGAAVEWQTTGDTKVCQACKPLQGIVVKTSEASGMIPRHPRCRCVWLPWIEPGSGEKRTKAAIEAAVKQSQARGSKGWGPGAPISADRPESILGNAATEPPVSVGPITADLLAFSRFLNNVFCPTGPGGGVDPHCSEGGKSAKAGPKPCPPPCDRPSKPSERHKGAAPVPLAYREPPPKKGKVGVGKVVRPKGDDSQTKIGDLGEELAGRLGFRSILPEGKRSFTAKEVEEKGSSIDLEYDHSGRLYELKVCNTTATEYRLKAKKEEKDAKLRFAENSKAQAYLLLGVRDVDRGEIHFYGSKSPGLPGSEVNPRDFDYLGKVAY